MAANKMVVTRVEGVANLTRALRALPIAMRQKVAPRMVARAANVIKEGARNIAQAKGLRISGALINNIVIKRELQTPASTVQYNVGVRHGRNITKKIKELALSKKSGRIVTRSRRVKTLRVIRYVNDPYYWRFVELGHKTVPRSAKYRRGKRGKLRDSVSIRVRRNTATGFVRPHPFLQPAFTQNQGRALSVMESTLQQFVAERRA